MKKIMWSSKSSKTKFYKCYRGKVGKTSIKIS